MKPFEIQRPTNDLLSVFSGGSPVPSKAAAGNKGACKPVRSGPVSNFGVDGFDPARLGDKSQKLLKVLDAPPDGIVLEQAGAAGLSAKLVGSSGRASQLGHKLSLSPPCAGVGASAQRPGFAARLPRYRRIKQLADRTLQDVMATGFERPHLKDRLLKLSSMQDSMISELRSDLRQAGLRHELVAAVPNERLPAVAAMLQAWSTRGVDGTERPLSAVTGADLHAMQALAARGDAVVDKVLASVPHLPESYLLRSKDLAFFDQLTKKSFVRGAALEERFDFAPSLLEASVLERLTDDGFRDLTAFLTELEASAGLRIVSGVQHRHGETSLESLIEYLGFEWGEDASTETQTDTETAAQARAKFIEGASDLARKTGQPFQTDHWPLALALGGEDAHVAESLDRVLDQVSPFGHPEAPWVVLDVAQKLAQTEPDVRKDALGLLKKTSQTLGKELAPHEAAAVIRAWAMGKQVHTYDPSQIRDLTHPAGESLALKDVHTWTRLRRVERQMDRSTLVDHVAKKILPGTTRADDNAEYSDRFEDHFHRLSTPELHKIRKLQEGLRTKAFKEQVRQMVALALFQPASEWGGQLKLDHGKVSVQMLPPAELGGSDSYAFPVDHANPVDALAHFHLHVCDERGDPRLAGPSSGYGGTVADRGAAYLFGQDGVVFSLVGPRTVNVDFFTAHGAVVNLGDFHIPPASTSSGRSGP